MSTVYGDIFHVSLLTNQTTYANIIEAQLILFKVLSATARGAAWASISTIERIRGLRTTAKGAATATVSDTIRIRGLRATAQGAATGQARPQKIANARATAKGAATAKATMLVLYIPPGVYIIDADEIFSRNQPLNPDSVANYIEVYINPLKPVDTPEEVYRSKDPVSIGAGEIKTTNIQYNEKPVIEAVARLENAPTGATISNVKYYAWGADVTVTSPNAGTFEIVVDGRPLKVQGQEVVVRKDETSILENGVKKYTFDNPFVQDRATAEMIAEKLLQMYSVPRSEMEIEWRGDPALVLADVTMIPEYQRKGLDQRGFFYVTRQQLDFDGGLKAKLEGRKM